MLKSSLLLLPLLASAALAQETPPAPAAFTREFGPPGAQGSFRARLQPQGAGLVFLQLADHFDTLAAARAATPDPQHYLLLAWNDADHALRIHRPAGASLFQVDPAEAVWQHEDLADGVRFSLDIGNGLWLVKTLRHEPAFRGFQLQFGLENRGGAAAGQLAFELTGPLLTNPADSSLFGNASVAVAVPVGGDPVHLGPVAGQLQPLEVPAGPLAFAGNTNRFFGAFLVPRDAAAQAALQRVVVEAGPVRDDAVSGTKANTAARARYLLQLPVPAAGASSEASFGLYLGPKSYRVFATLPEAERERFAPILDVDLNAPCCVIEVPGGRFMAKQLLWLLGWFRDLCGNWGIAIVMLTILVRGLLAPVNFRMQKSMRAYGQRMAVLKPKMEALKQKHGDDQRAYQQAMIQFQREHKVMPPLGGCLPIFATMPIYIGLFTALRTAYDLRQQPFLAWIEDLSRPDMLADMPFWPHHFNLLPPLWIAMFLWMQLRMPLPTDPQARQVQSTMRFMPLIFGVMLYNYASALMVYMVTSMLWSMAESAITKRILGPIDPNAAAMAPQPMM